MRKFSAGAALSIQIMELQKDIRKFTELLVSHKVEFILVGGYALAFHGAPRFTEDIDFLLRISPENAARVEAVLGAFGFGDVGITRRDFLEAEQVIQLGRAEDG
ncbi:MAG TPA: nucleotidyl transferase AbiEii/AbiGii toxin family protein [Verrucomicrobiae bacterium]|nr:nucleotidyl transferase AbiEii/AbiGii toxin family protein [Verrucomicrobiae bacterium]